MNIPIKNACLYNPKRKGFISSIIASFGFGSAAGCTFLGDFIVNPQRVVLSEEEKFFAFEVAKNVKKYYLFMYAFIGGCSILSLLFVFQYKPENNSLIKELKSNRNFSINDADNANRNYYSPQLKPKANARTDLIVPPMTLSAVIIPVQSFYHSGSAKNFKQIISSCGFWVLALNQVCTFFTSSMSVNTFKTLGVEHGFSVNNLTASYSFSLCSLMFIGPLIGYLSDCMSFAVLNSFLNIIEIISSLAMFYSLRQNNCIMFCVFSAFQVMAFSNFNLIINSHVMKVYTLQFFVEVIGSLGIVSVFGSVLESFVPLIADQLFDDQDNMFAYFFGIGLNVLGVMLSAIEKETKFEFQKTEKEKEKEEIKDIDEINDINDL